MEYSYYNPNPRGKRVGDCAVRAVSKALDVDWQTAYAMITANGLVMGDMPSSDAVWGATLKQNWFHRYAIPDTCPDCYTAGEFAEDHPRGIYVLGFGGHTACIKNGVLYDSFDSSDFIPIFYWYRGDI